MMELAEYTSEELDRLSKADQIDLIVSALEQPHRSPRQVRAILEQLFILECMFRTGK